MAALALGVSTFLATAQDDPNSGPGNRRPRPAQGGEQGGPGGPGQPGGPGGQRPMMSPIMGALDANHDGVIDEKEIANASAALKTLDKNGDGKLTSDEIRPARPTGQGGPGGPGGPGGDGQRPQRRPGGPGNQQ